MLSAGHVFQLKNQRDIYFLRIEKLSHETVIRWDEFKVSSQLQRRSVSIVSALNNTEEKFSTATRSSETQVR